MLFFSIDAFNTIVEFSIVVVGSFSGVQVDKCVSE